MSYEIIPFQPNKVPEHLRGGELSELAKKLRSGLGNVKRISIRNGVFRCVVGGEEVAKNKQGYMDIVIVNTTKEVQRSYYSKAFDPNEEKAAPPDCQSADGIAPHPSVENPQATTCASCPMNISGSGQGKKKACRYSKRVAVALATDLDSGVFQLSLPSQSIFAKGDEKHMGFEQYIKYLLSMNFSPDRVVTRMSFDDDADSVKLVFSAVGHPNAGMLRKIEELVGSPEAELAVQMSVYQTDNGKNPAAKALPIIKEADEDSEEDDEEEVAPPPKKAKKPAVVVDEDEDEDEEDVPAPVVKAKVKQEEPKGKKTELNAILSKFSGVKRPAVEDDDEDDE